MKQDVSRCLQPSLVIISSTQKETVENTRLEFLSSIKAEDRVLSIRRNHVCEIVVELLISPEQDENLPLIRFLSEQQDLAV